MRNVVNHEWVEPLDSRETRDESYMGTGDSIFDSEHVSLEFANPRTIPSTLPHDAEGLRCSSTVKLPVSSRSAVSTVCACQSRIQDISLNDMFHSTRIPYVAPPFLNSIRFRRGHLASLQPTEMEVSMELQVRVLLPEPK
jgi:hypothetical protein